MSSTLERLREEDIPPAADAAPAPGDDLPLTVIERQPGWRLVNLREMWRYRELLYFLTWRDVKVRYKQTVLGAAWAVLQPLATMVVFTLFLGRLPALADGEWPYPLFVFTGLLPWTFFAAAMGSASNSKSGATSSRPGPGSTPYQSMSTRSRTKAIAKSTRCAPVAPMGMSRRGK